MNRVPYSAAAAGRQLVPQNPIATNVIDLTHALAATSLFRVALASDTSPPSTFPRATPSRLK
jgi:hypothetical protein